MKKNVFLSGLFSILTYFSYSQSVGIGTATPNASAALDITATNKGLLIPRMSLNSINAIVNPANQFLGTTDNQPLRFRINNIKAGELNSSGNIFWGLRAGQSNTSGFSNVAIGTDALKFDVTGANLVAI